MTQRPIDSQAEKLKGTSEGRKSEVSEKRPTEREGGGSRDGGGAANPSLIDGHASLSVRIVQSWIR